MNVCMLLTSYKNLAINYMTRCLACMVLRQANVVSKLQNSLQKTENNTVYKLVLPKAFSQKLFTTIKMVIPKLLMQYTRSYMLSICNHDNVMIVRS